MRKEANSLAHHYTQNGAPNETKIYRSRKRSENLVWNIISAGGNGQLNVTSGELHPHEPARDLVRVCTFRASV